MEQTKTKKPTNAQLQKRINNAIVHIDKTKDTKTIFFSDKGLRLTTTEDFAIIETNFHRHIFNAVNFTGMSRPWFYTSHVIDVALENDCRIDDGYSYEKLLGTLKEKEDQSEYNILVYYNWWCFNIFQPLYSIGEQDGDSFLVYEDYLHNIARNVVIMDEHKEDVSNIAFIKNVCKNMLSYIKGVNEYVVIKALTDDERIKQEIDAIENEFEDSAIESQSDNMQND